MQSAKKTTKILSALSMAAVATLAAKSAHGATLNLYYGQDPSYGNSNNSIFVSNTYNPGAAGVNLVGGTQALGATPTNIAVNPAGPTTITVPVGSYLSLAIDALLTGATNADGGKSTSSKHIVQPSFLGLSALGVGVGSSDASAQFLTPISNDNPAAPLSSFNGHPTYNSTAVINSGQATNGGAAYNVVPAWAITAGGDVQPNVTGYDAAHGNGNVGLNGFMTGGNTSVAASTTTGAAELEQFASSTNTNAYAGATDFADSLIYQGLKAGVVTLSPFAVGSSTQYWTLKTGGTATSASVYTAKTISGTDTVNSLPVLVIDVVPSGPTGPISHAIVSLAATAAANVNYGSTVGALHITGSAAAGYTTGQVTGLTPANGVGNVTTDAWNATTDPEIYGVDVQVNGAQATPSQLATLLAAIAGDGAAPASDQGVAASTTDPTGGVLAGLHAGGATYNLFLKYAGGGPSIPQDDLGLDLSSANDSNLAGFSFSAVAVVPEPVSMSLLALGGIGLMSRRHRRNA